jgi:hypothetical protein
MGIRASGKKSKKVGYSRKATSKKEENTKCVRILIPAIIRYEEYTVSSGPSRGPFVRSITESIDEKAWRGIELQGASDNCGKDEAKLRELQKSGWEVTSPLPVPESLESYEDNYKIEKGWSLNIGLEPLAGLSLGPTANIESLKEIGYSYVLVGNNKYTAYSPQKSFFRYWSSSPL